MSEHVPFWDSPAFTTAMVLLMSAIIAWITSRTNAKVHSVKEEVKEIKQEVLTVKGQTNGIVSALQGKVASQDVDKQHTAEITKKNIEIAELKRDKGE